MQPASAFLLFFFVSVTEVWCGCCSWAGGGFFLGYPRPAAWLCGRCLVLCSRPAGPAAGWLGFPAPACRPALCGWCTSASESFRGLASPSGLCSFSWAWPRGDGPCGAVPLPWRERGGRAVSLSPPPVGIRNLEN